MERGKIVNLKKNPCGNREHTNTLFYNYVTSSLHAIITVVKVEQHAG